MDALGNELIVEGIYCYTTSVNGITQINYCKLVKIKENSELADPLTSAKALSGALSGVSRYRIGNYRALFEIDSDRTLSVLIVLRVKHRKEVYD